MKGNNTYQNYIIYIHSYIGHLQYIHFFWDNFSLYCVNAFLCSKWGILGVALVSYIVTQCLPKRNYRKLSPISCVGKPSCQVLTWSRSDHLIFVVLKELSLFTFRLKSILLSNNILNFISFVLQSQIWISSKLHYWFIWELKWKK